MGGVNISTYAQIAAAIITNPAASALMTASTSSVAVAGAFAATNLAGGAGVALLGIPMLVRSGGKCDHGKPSDRCRLGNATTTSTRGGGWRNSWRTRQRRLLPLVRVIGDGTLVLSDSGGPVDFYGGTNTPQVVTVQGANLGVKLFKDC